MHNGATVMDGSALADGTAFVPHGLCLVARTGFMHGLHSLGRCFMNGRSCLVAGTFLHRGFHLMTGGAFLCFPTDLLGLRRGSAAAVGAGCRRFGYTHYERSA